MPWLPCIGLLFVVVALALPARAIRLEGPPWPSNG